MESPPGERDIVVDGLRHVDDPEIALGLPADPVGHEEGAFTADREEIVYAEPADGGHHDAELLLHVVGIVTGCPQDGAAPRGDPRDFVDGERPDIALLAFEEGLEAAENADDVHALVDRLDGRRADDAIDPRGRTSAYDYGEHFFFHGSSLQLIEASFQPIFFLSPDS